MAKPMSVELAKHIVRLRHKDAYTTYNGQLGVTEVWSTPSGGTFLGQASDRHNDAAWKSAVLLILADPEFWLDDERVVRASYPEAKAVEMEDDSWRIYDSPSLFRGVPLNISAKNKDEAWKSSRNHQNVQSFEQQYRPKDEKWSDEVRNTKKVLRDNLNAIHDATKSKEIGELGMAYLKHLKSRAELAESKLAGCREETIKECAAVAGKMKDYGGGWTANASSIIEKELLSKLPSVAEKKS